MHTNGVTAKWIGLVAGAIIVLGFGAVGVSQSGILKRVEVNEVDIRRVDKNQAVIIFQLKGIDTKLDRLLEAD